MDIWEANSQAAAYTPHVCSVQGQVRCEGELTHIDSHHILTYIDQAPTAAMAMSVTTVFVTRTAATSTRTAWATPRSTALA